MTSSISNCLQSLHLQIPSQWGLGLQYVHLGWGHKHAVHNTSPNTLNTSRRPRYYNYKEEKHFNTIYNVSKWNFSLNLSVPSLLLEPLFLLPFFSSHQSLPCEFQRIIAIQSNVTTIAVYEVPDILTILVNFFAYFKENFVNH